MLQDANNKLREAPTADTWLVETGDRGHIPEPRDIVAPFTKEMHDWFGTPAWAQAQSGAAPAPAAAPAPTRR